MSTLIRKELRENFKLALIGFALFAFMLVVNYHASTGLYASLALGQTSWNIYTAQPLLSNGVISVVGIFCTVFAALLGWLQIHNERHRDLWAFLIHRPVSRTKIFAAKAVAGLCLYALGAGLPLLGLIAMTRMPGQIAAPFEWAMVLPVFSFFLSGMVCYFAGLLTGLRQARWYASRGLGLGAALLVCVAMGNMPEFSRALVLILVAGAVLATAAWGSFMSSGYYEGQPALGRRALAGSLAAGCLLVLGFAAVMLGSLLPNEIYAWSRYQITKDGAIYKMTQPAGKPLEITDLNGVPLNDPKTGRTITPTDFNHLAAPESVLRPDFVDLSKNQSRVHGTFQQTSRFFSLWRQTPDTLWYWNRNGRLWGFDIASRRFLGSLGPEGFAPGKSSGPARFSQAEGQSWSDYYNASYPARTLLTDHAVYQLDLEHRAIKPFFEATNHDRVGGALDVALQGYGWDYTIVATKESVCLLTPDGHIVWQRPYVPGYPAYNDVEVSFLEVSNRFVLQFRPAYQPEQTNRLPLHVVWLAAGQGVINQQDLPSNPRVWTPPWPQRLLGLVLPPAFWPVVGWLYGHWIFTNFLRPEMLWLSLAAAVISAGAGWWLGRRYHFPVASQLKWAVFHLLMGLPGLLGFLCVQEWAAREACPSCEKLRLVDRDKCEYCGAGFAPPPKNGTEIFAPAGASSAGSVPIPAMRE